MKRKDTRKVRKSIYAPRKMEWIEALIYVTNIWFGALNFAQSEPANMNQTGIFTLAIAILSGVLPFVLSVVALPMFIFWRGYLFQQRIAAATMLASVFVYLYGTLINVGLQSDLFAASSFLFIAAAAAIVFVDIRTRDVS